jgi:hypothetical protein
MISLALVSFVERKVYKTNSTDTKNNQQVTFTMEPQRLQVKHSLLYSSLLFKRWILYKGGWRYSPLKIIISYILTLIELIWTITPALILILIAFPSFKLLYLMDEVTDPSITVFVEGNLRWDIGPKSYMLEKNLR